MATAAVVSLDSEKRGVDSMEALLVAQATFEPTFKEFSALRESERGALRTLEWEDISYRIKIKGEERVILDGITGAAKTGEVVAVLGPSKSGKTRFLNAISGHVTMDHGKHTLHGVVKLGGEVASVQDLKHRSGFVLRHEAMHPTSTPLESIRFAARLKLPVHVTAEKRDALVADLVASLGLGEVANVPAKQLTPGQRKRLAIGVELASLPSTLFLDEPSAEMDTIEAWTVMHTIKGLVSSGRSSCLVVCTMNEASSVVFSQISRIILLRQGRVVYQGLVENLLPTFEAKKFFMPSGTNLADFALTLVRLAPAESLPSVTEAQSRPGTLNKQESFGEGAVKASIVPEQRAGFGTQFAMLMNRQRRNMLRDKRFVIGRCVSSLIIFAIVACVFIGAADQTKSNYFFGSQLGAIVFSYFASTFNAMIMAILISYDEKHVYIRERASGTYGPVPTFFVKLISEMPVNLLVAVLIILEMYWSVGWKANFGWFVLGLFLLNEVCYATGYAMAGLLTSSGLAIGLVPALLVPQLLFIGTFVRINQLPYWLTWVQKVCTVKYAINIPQIYEFAPENCNSIVVCSSWNATLMANDVQPGLLGEYIGVLVGLDFVLRLIGLFAHELKAGRAVQFGEHA